MSVFTKIFIVINLALTLGLTGVAGSLFAQRANHHYSNYKAAHELWRKTLADLTSEKKRGTERLLALKSSTDEEEQRASAAVKRYGELLGKKADLSKNIASKSSAISEFRTQLQKGEKTNNDLNDDVKSLTGQRNQAENTKNDAVAFRNRAYNNLRETEDDVSSAEQAITNIKASQLVHLADIKTLEGLLEQARRKEVPVEKIADQHIKDLARKLEGEVEKVDLGVFLLFVDLGESDGVKEGMFFTVYRGDKYICKVQVKTVNPDNASAWVLVETMVQGRQPQQGDKVKNHD